MDLVAEERPGDSPLIERIWRTQDENPGAFTSISQNHWEIVITRYQGKTIVTLRGPETRVSSAYWPPGAEFFGIQFKPGVFMPAFPPATMLDRRDVNLPEASSKSFWLNGSAWQLPDYENADTFVEWLARDGLLVHDPLVSAVLQGQPVEMSLRTVQRRFLQATGLTHNTLFQIERARHAAALLKQGQSILDVVDLVGYADQPHLTRALKQFIGQTPAQIMNPDRTMRLSFLFKTPTLGLSYPVIVDDKLPKGQVYEKNRRHGIPLTGWSHGSAAELALPLRQR